MHVEHDSSAALINKKVVQYNSCELKNIGKNETINVIENYEIYI